MKHVFKRILSCLLAVCLLASLVPAAFAAGTLQTKAKEDGFPYFWQETEINGDAVLETFEQPTENYFPDRNVYMAVQAGDNVRYVAAGSSQDPWKFQYKAPEMDAYKVALVQPVLDGGDAQIEVQLKGASIKDGYEAPPYTLTLKATLRMSEQMAQVAAVNKDDPHMQDMKFICHIENPYLADLEPERLPELQVTGGVFQPAGKPVKTDDGYTMAFKLAEDWSKDKTTEQVKDTLRQEMTITASLSNVSYEELLPGLDEGKLYIHGWIELYYGDGTSSIPGFPNQKRVIVPANQQALTVESPGQLVVTVTDQEGKPLSGAEVRITWVNNVWRYDFIEVDNTNSEGKVTFNDIPCGAYKVEVSYEKDGRTYETSVTWTVADRKAELPVRLELAGPGEGILNTRVDGDQSASANNLENAISKDKVGADTVTIILNVDETSKTENPQAEQMLEKYGTEYDAAAEQRGQTVFTDFVDATLKEEREGKEKNLSESEGVIEIHIPLSQELMELIEAYDLDPQDTQVYRAHTNARGETELEQLTRGSGGDGTYTIEHYGSGGVKEHTQYYAVIRAQKFSVYGFAIPIPTASSGGGSTLYPVYTETSGHGAVSASHSRAAAGAQVTVTVSPEEGYRLSSLAVTDKNGRQLEVTAKGGGVYTFTMPASAAYVKAGFALAIATPESTGVADWLNTTDHTAYMMGYDTGAFAPDDDVTRAQVAQMFYRLLKDQNVPVTVSFRDVAGDAWYAQAVHTLASLGIVNGVGNGRFEPERAITRAEFSAMAVRFARETETYPIRFQDVPESFWAYRYISTAAAYGWVTGVGGNRFAPYDKISRAQAAVMVNRMTGRLADQAAIDSGKGARFPDVAKTHWAWYDIVEATTTHDYTKQDMTETWKN